MKILKFENKKVFDFLVEKDGLVREGRKISDKIEKLDTEIEKNNDEERKITEAYEPQELIDRGNAIQAEVNKLIVELEQLGDQISKDKLAQIPKELMDRHYKKRDEKEALERERNKIALKIQKIKDRVAPMVKKMIAPHLEKYEDTETVRIVGKTIMVSIFSHLEDWKDKFEKRFAK